jgi:di/tricarboxylate transporter
VFAWFAILIALEFSGVVSLTALFLFVAIFLILSVLLFDYYSFSCSFDIRRVFWRRLLFSKPNNGDGDEYPSPLYSSTMELNRAQKINNITKTVEDLFGKLDYNIIILFTGLFIVAGYFQQTGIPTALWVTFSGGSSKAFKVIIIHEYSF